MTEVLYLVIAFGFKCVRNMLMASSVNKALHKKVKHSLLDEFLIYHTVRAIRDGKTLNALITGPRYFPKESVLNSLKENERFHFARDTFTEIKPRLHDFRVWEIAYLRRHDGFAVFNISYDFERQVFEAGNWATEFNFTFNHRSGDSNTSVYSEGIEITDMYVGRKRPKLHQDNPPSANIDPA
jgi:hypothetical protein